METQVSFLPWRKPGNVFLLDQTILIHPGDLKTRKRTGTSCEIETQFLISIKTVLNYTL